MKMTALVPLLSIFLFFGCQSPPEESVPQVAVESNSGQIVHHVFFWLNNPGSEVDKMELMEGLESLRAIEEVKELWIGTPASTLVREVVDNSFHVSELMIFESTEAQDAYQVHPIHEAFVENYSHLWERVIVYDMVIN